MSIKHYKMKCPYRFENHPYLSKNPPCHNKVGQEAMRETEWLSLVVCALCMEGIRTRAYIKKLFEITYGKKRR